jgi:hypothetical protein
MPDPKYKIGDLVRITEKISIYIDQVVASPGDVGVISKVQHGCSDFLALWGVDYYVLINGTEFLFFEEEIELYSETLNKTAKEVKFVLLKK